MLKPLLMAMEAWPFTTGLVASNFWFPLVLASHLLGMATLVGCIAAVDLRLLWASARHHDLERFSAAILPWTWAAFALSICTGILLFAPQAVMYSANPLFRAKFVLMVLAGVNMAVFHLLIRRDVAGWNLGPPPFRVRLTGGLSLALWLGVLASGRLIAYF